MEGFRATMDALDKVPLDTSTRDTTSLSDIEDRIQHVNQSLRREIERQTERVQRAALEEVGALRKEFAAVKEEMASFQTGGFSSRLSSAGGGPDGRDERSVDLSARSELDHLGPLPPRSASARAGLPQMARLSSEVWDAVDESDVLDKAFLEALDTRSKEEDAPRRKAFTGDSACPGPAAAQMAHACPDPDDSFADSPIPKLPESDAGGSDGAPFDEAPCDEAPDDMDVTAATDRDLEVLESRVREELGSHARALEVKHGKGLADFEARLSKLDAAQQALDIERIASLDARLDAELERIASEHRYGRSLTATAVAEQQEESAASFREAFNAFESKFRLEVDAKQEESRTSCKKDLDDLRSELSGIAITLSEQQAARSELQSAHDQLRLDHAQEAHFRSELQGAHNQLRLDHSEARETQDTKFKLELDGVKAQVEATQQDLRESQDQRYDLRFNKVVAVQLEGREHCENSIKALGERLGKQLGDVEAKAIEGFPQKCAEHRQSHFKALESILREEFDSKRSRIEANLRSAVEASEVKIRKEISQQLRPADAVEKTADAIGKDKEARVGCPDAGG